VIYAVSKWPEAVRITGNNSEFQGAKINDTSFIRVPRQNTNIEAEMPILAGYTGYGLWICTLFAPFEFTKERIVNNKESLKHGSNMANEEMDEIRTMLDNENSQYEVGRTERS
jgi:Cys-tRNA synthase (O-phospho-L-seryl-tRNA:Cys-tRNA synthase)